MIDAQKENETAINRKVTGCTDFARGKYNESI